MKEIHCKICQGRKEKIAELNRIAETDGAFVREKRRTRDLVSKADGYVERLDECPQCRKNGTITGMNDFGANFEQTTHYHRCGICGTKLPKDEDSVYKGTFVCSDLGDCENGEIITHRKILQAPAK